MSRVGFKEGARVEIAIMKAPLLIAILLTVRTIATPFFVHIIAPVKHVSFAKGAFAGAGPPSTGNAPRFRIGFGIAVLVPEHHHGRRGSMIAFVLRGS